MAEPRTKSRSHTRKGPGIMPYRRTSRPGTRVCRGPGSLDAEAHCYRLAGQNDFKAAIAAAEKHNQISYRSSLRISKFVLDKWREYAQVQA